MERVRVVLGGRQAMLGAGLEALRWSADTARAGVLGVAAKGIDWTRMADTDKRIIA